MSNELTEKLVCELSERNPAYTPKDVISALQSKPESKAMTAEQFADTVLEVFDQSSMAVAFYSMRKVGA